MTSVILTIVDRPDSAPNVLAAAGCFATLLNGADIVFAVQTPGPEELARYLRPDRFPQRPGTAR